MIKIVVVDDEQRTCGYLTDFFKNRGYKSFAVIDSLKAEDLIRKEKPHVVLLDIHMPGINGMDLLKKIKQKYNDNIKVVMVTAEEDEQIKEAAVLAGADGFVTKPFDSNYLDSVVMKKIQELLGYRREEKSE